jgi:DNA-binding response OmpR family regulator
MMGEKIMIVDDDKEFLDELEDLLGASGYTVRSVSEGMAATKQALEMKPDVILLDLKMGGMSGFEVADELRRFAETSHIPLVAMSGFYAMDENSWLMNFCRFKKCLKKPFNPLDVIATIETVLRKS